MSRVALCREAAGGAPDEQRLPEPGDGPQRAGLRPPGNRAPQDRATQDGRQLQGQFRFLRVVVKEMSCHRVRHYRSRDFTLDVLLGARKRFHPNLTRPLLSPTGWSLVESTIFPDLRLNTSGIIAHRCCVGTDPTRTCATCPARRPCTRRATWRTFSSGTRCCGSALTSRCPATRGRHRTKRPPRPRTTWRWQ